MVFTLALLALSLVITVVLVQVRANRKLKKQTRLLLMQGREIQMQLRELQQQNKLLEELNNEKQQIISVVSHDLKGPFNRIFALVHLMSLSEESLTEQQQDYLGKIHQIVADGLGMVRNLLDNRKIEDKNAEINPEPLNLAAMLASHAKNYGVLAEKKKILVHYEGPPKCLWVTDKVYLTRIMDNLLSNAIKFSPQEKNIFVKLIESENFVEVKVTDEGQGIPLEDQNRLFQKYVRLTPRPTGGESSTGLGLFLVKAMMGKLKGDVTCISEIQKGTTFTLHFPKLIS
jgi:two-component system, sensor histidine kinase and response regulator